MFLSFLYVSVLVCTGPNLRHYNKEKESDASTVPLSFDSYHTMWVKSALRTAWRDSIALEEQEWSCYPVQRAPLKHVHPLDLGPSAECQSQSFSWTHGHWPVMHHPVAHQPFTGCSRIGSHPMAPSFTLLSLEEGSIRRIFLSLVNSTGQLVPIDRHSLRAQIVIQAYDSPKPHKQTPPFLTASRERSVQISAGLDATLG